MLTPSMSIHLSCSKTYLAKFLPILNMLPCHPFKSLSTRNLSPQFPATKSLQIKFPSIHNIQPNFPYIEVFKTKFLQTYHMPHQLPLLTILHQFKIIRYLNIYQRHKLILTCNVFHRYMLHKLNHMLP